MLHWLLSQIGKVKNQQKLHVLIYHQVLDAPDPIRPSEPDTQRFEWQMALLHRYFTPLSLDEALTRLDQGTLPANAICVTFDDGYKNNLYNAQPILERYQIPAMYYVSTGFCGNDNMWNDRILWLFAQTTLTSVTRDGEVLDLPDWPTRRKHAHETLKLFKRLPIDARLDAVLKLYQDNGVSEQSALMMTPEEVKQLSTRPGATVGAHTVNHPILKVLAAEQQRQEILQSKLTLEQWTGQVIEHFAYPNGVWNHDADQTTADIVKDLGFKSAVITNWGKANQGTDKFKIPRFTGWDKSPLKWHTRLINSPVKPL